MCYSIWCGIYLDKLLLLTVDHLYTNWCNTTKIFRFSCWRFKSSGTWSCVTEQVSTNVLTAIWSPNTSVTTCPNSAGESSVWRYSCLRTSSLCPVPPRSHYRLNQFLCNITILSRGMIQCFSCFNRWIAATERRHRTVSIHCMLLYRVFLTSHISCNATHLQCGTIRPYYMWMCYPYFCIYVVSIQPLPHMPNESHTQFLTCPTILTAVTALCYRFVQCPFCYIQPQITTVTCKWVM